MEACAGPFNSWDRQVYQTEWGVVKYYDELSNNMMISNYQVRQLRARAVSASAPSCARLCVAIFAWHCWLLRFVQGQEAVDNDDGSAMYFTHDNVLVYSGNGMKNGQ